MEFGGGGRSAPRPKDGIADNLDPGCVKVFQGSLQRSYEIMKMAMTEMQSHISKGKWG